MKRLFALLLALLMVFQIGCGTEDELVVSEPAESGEEEVLPSVEQPGEPEAPEYPWIAPEFASMGYEEFFAQERAYHDPDAEWYGYTSTRNSLWIVEHGTSGTLYELESDENGFFICGFRKEENPLHRIPNTGHLADCEKVVTNTRQLYCAKDGRLFCVDVLTGESRTLYTAEHIPDLELCHNDVLYFLALSDGILCLNRLYVPSMTLELLYAGTAPEVPASCYDLLLPNTSESTITWETINPSFWQAITEILADPEREYPGLYYPDAFALDYIIEHPFGDEMVQHNFALFQGELNLRPRMRGYYDPVADTYDEKYGIYDVCFFGTGVHNDEEHFGSDSEYRK